MAVKLLSSFTSCGSSACSAYPAVSPSTPFIPIYVGSIIAHLRNTLPPLSGPAIMSPLRQPARSYTHSYLRYSVPQNPTQDDKQRRIEEAALVKRAKTDSAAFGDLYERYVKAIYNYVYYRIGNHHDAEDLTAKVFQRALKHIPKYIDRGVPFSAWLYRIAHNLVANWHRDQSRRSFIPLDEFVMAQLPGDGPERTTESREEQDILLTAIRRLPEDRQQLLYLKFIERMSNAEIGEIMDRSEGAIKSLYHRTLVTLREDLETVSPGFAFPLDGEED